MKKYGMSLKNIEKEYRIEEVYFFSSMNLKNSSETR